MGVTMSENSKFFDDLVEDIKSDYLLNNMPR